MRKVPPAALAAISGLLLIVVSDPIAFAPLAWVALVPLFVAILRAPTARRAAGYGVMTGVIFFAVHLYWIFLFGWMAFFGFVAALSLYMGLAAALAQVLGRHKLAPALIAGAWAAGELLRQRWPAGGFGWGALGETQYVAPGLRWTFGSVGVYGLSLLCAFVSALIAVRIVHGTWRWTPLALVASVFAVFVLGDALLAMRDVPGRPTRVAVIQGNVPRPVRADQGERIFESHERLTRSLSGPRPDVIAWPEAAVGFDAPPDALDRVSRLARELQTNIIVGRNELSGDGFLNDVVAFDPSGRRSGEYRKRHPVPFGEFVPVPGLRRLLPFLAQQVPLDMVRGRRSTPIRLANAVLVGTPICFESTFPRDVLAFGDAGAQFHIVMTNMSSYERTVTARQHIAHARMRALEMRQWVVQAALSGISGVAAPDGSLSQTTRLFEPAVIVTTVQARPARTLFARTGNLFALGWALTSVWCAVMPVARRRRAAGRATVAAP